MHYEVVWPDGDLLGIFPSYSAALERARVWWERGYACRIRRCVVSLAPSALTMSAAVKKLRRGDDDEVSLALSEFCESKTPRKLRRESMP